ncbi:uncharacterized protein BYT42DRAFT_590908 [Radiomyces spectabilis]|uniref:uncharacterized protein n=1 Tax=Radiomyces spectabilis TaxID=64574 RepID=UPI00221E7B9A|nr:uncharacterized protein BYT42DRAFT_590908 [Radiomyces spectabilis]KAI8364143.1 hypothetical protein BYT42DRAFT_590908 [Radiomyces spectabilis]
MIFFFCFVLLERYAARSRHPSVQRLTLPQLYTFYNLEYSRNNTGDGVNDEDQDNDDDENDDDEEQERPNRSRQRRLNTALVNVPYHNEALPRTFMDNFGGTWRLRLKKIPLWRTRSLQPSAGDVYFFQQIAINYACPSIADFTRQFPTVRDAYYALVERGDIELAEALQGYVHYADDSDNLEELAESTTERLERQKLTLTDEQCAAYDMVVNSIEGRRPCVVLGGAGCGKSYLLRVVELQYIHAHQKRRGNKLILLW